ncbi:hypothetical protein INT47_004971 [Mucor saturninus]|uniref:Uncharacterized protein n=1 Tax=Mucor saturninus TaxID=64648 RepID=A0A8H7QSX2_9FUNG|nr:hypothetical protein INT47_004971 [Mucor saturninus]
MFQFLNEWKRKANNNVHDEQDVHSDNAMTRTCSNTSDSSSSPSDCSMDWNQKRALSFKEDYVSFPSLEPSASELTSN